MRIVCGRVAVGNNSCVQTQSQLVELVWGIWDVPLTRSVIVIVYVSCI